MPAAGRYTTGENSRTEFPAIRADVRSSGLEDGSNTLTAGRADRDQPAYRLPGLLLALGQLLGQLGDDPPAGRGERMPGRQGRTVDVELGAVDRAQRLVEAQAFL